MIKPKVFALGAIGFISTFPIFNYSCISTGKKDRELKITKNTFKIPVQKNKYDHQALVLGSFHFNRSSDGSDVVAKNHIDIATPENQQQIKEIVNQIVTGFKPTIVAVEFFPRFQSEFDSLLMEFKKGNWNLGKNEAFQIGFRVAKALDLTRVHCIDNRPLQPESVRDLDNWEDYAKKVNQEALWKEYDEANSEYNGYLDDIQNEADVKSYLSLLNSEEVSKRNKEFWFTGLANLGVGHNYVGADLTGYWYRRNTRIFINARNLCETSAERILIIYGNGHKWALDEMIDGSPEFTLKQFKFPE
ncbi:MAG: DUF5694 domain-containing protein [Bacteroidota bacterium]